MAKSDNMNAHKVYAETGKPPGYARGGRVTGPSPTPTGAGKMVPSMKGANPLTTAKKNNGVPGMCVGGRMKK